MGARGDVGGTVPVGMTNGAGGLVDASRSGLRLDPRMPFETWKALGGRIKVRSDASSWWLGDWLVFGRHEYGERHREAIAATGLDDRTLDSLAVIARRFRRSRRRESLSFQHHADVCDMPDAAQESWLNLATKNGWSKGELRLRIRDAARSSPDQQAGQMLRVGLKVEAAQERSWREAASRNGCRLEDWIVGALDGAAQTP
jgi:hypothetical protein